MSHESSGVPAGPDLSRYRDMSNIELSEAWEHPMPDDLRELIRGELEARGYRLASLPPAPAFHPEAAGAVQAFDPPRPDAQADGLPPQARPDGPRPPNWQWHYYLFFRPRQFFQHFVQRSEVTLVATLLYGVSGALGRDENNFLRGRSASWWDSWSSYWMMMLLFGAIGAVFYWHVGGWWYRKRVQWSGSPSPDPVLARRVLVFAAQVHALPTIILAMIAWGRHATPREAMAVEASLTRIVCVMVVAFWSLGVSYVGVRTLFSVQRVRAWVWFVAVPGLFYLLAFGAILEAR